MTPILGRSKTLTGLWHGACHDLLFAPAEKLDWAAGATTGRNDNLLMCNSMEYDFDLGRDLWLTAGRFKKLQRDYLDYELLEPFIDKCASMPANLARRGTVTQMNTRVHGVVKHNGRKDNYTWGNCIFGFSFRPSEEQPGIFTMHSRTSYVCYMGGLDLALAYTIAKEIAKRRGDVVQEYGFRWMIDSLQWYSIKAMAYIHQYDLVDEIHRIKKWPDKQFPTAKITRNSYDFLHRREEDNNPPKYGPTHRVWSLMFGHNNRPVSCPVDTLELEALT